VEKAAQVSFSMFITNEVVRVAWFGVVNVMIAKFALPLAAQWALWGLGVLAAFVFAFLFHALIDTPIQDRIRAGLKGRSRLKERMSAVARPAVSLKG
jgi:peptidoglycan/LPS O-acetylase OafA/YrhL